MNCLKTAVNVTGRNRNRKNDIRNVIVITPGIKFIERQHIKWFEHLVQWSQTA